VLWLRGTDVVGEECEDESTGSCTTPKLNERRSFLRIKKGRLTRISFELLIIRVDSHQVEVTH